MTGDLERQMTNHHLPSFTAPGRALSQQQRVLARQTAYTADYMTAVTHVYKHGFRLLADLDVERQIEAGNSQLLNELFVQMELRRHASSAGLRRTSDGRRLCRCRCWASRPHRCDLYCPLRCYLGHRHRTRHHPHQTTHNGHQHGEWTAKRLPRPGLPVRPPSPLPHPQHNRTQTPHHHDLRPALRRHRQPPGPRRRRSTTRTLPRPRHHPPTPPALLALHHHPAHPDPPRRASRAAPHSQQGRPQQPGRPRLGPADQHRPTHPRSFGPRFE